MESLTAQLYFPAQAASGYQRICDPLNSALRWMHFGRIQLQQSGMQWERTHLDHEMVLVLLQGSATVQLDNGTTITMGPRHDPWQAPPTILIVPPGQHATLGAGSHGAELAVVSTPAMAGGEVIQLPPERIATTIHGSGRFRREVSLGTVDAFPEQRLMVGETRSVPGGWTSFPPHKHDTVLPPTEMPYEELYFYLMAPSAGFGFQRIYNPPEREDPLDMTFCVHTGDTVVIPHGYHPFVGAPGIEVYYLWAMCGEPGLHTYGQNSIDPIYAHLQSGTREEEPS